jgi:hypothetical protein
LPRPITLINCDVFIISSFIKVENAGRYWPVAWGTHTLLTWVYS